MPPSIEITTLQEKPHLTDAVLSLVEDALDYAPTNRFATDFYPLVKKSNHENLHVLLENGTLAAHIGLLPKTLTFQNNHFPVTLMGGVATARDQRGKGHFDKLIRNILSTHSRTMGYFLWGNLESLYDKYGFHQIGILREQKGVPFFPPLDYCQTLYGELDSEHKRQLQNIHSLNTRNFISIRRDWEDIENITSTRLHIKQNRNSEIMSYFFVGKGQDLPGIVHEAFSAPGYSHDLTNLPCWMPDIPPYGHWPTLYGCLFKIGEADLFKKFIELYSRKNLYIEAIDHERVTFSFKKKPFHLSTSNFLTGLFGPGVMDEFKSFYTPLWFGGLDSV